MIDNIKLMQARTEAGLTQTELANKLGVAQATVCAWESGVCNPRVSTLFELCKILNLDVKKFFIEENGNEHSKKS